MSIALSLLASLAAVAPAQDLVLEGVVLDPQGKPAAGVRCLASAQWGRRTAGPPSAEVFDDLSTASDGRFALHVPASFLPLGDGARLDLWAWREDLSLEVRSYGPEELPIGEVVALRTRPAEGGRVTVLDENDHPLAGARVLPVQSADYELVPDPLAEALTIVTDASGIATSAAWDPAGWSVVVVESDSHGSQQHSGNPGWLADRVVRLLPSGLVRFEVVGERPSCCAGLTLTVNTFGASPEDDRRTVLGELRLPLDSLEVGPARPIAVGTHLEQLELPCAPDRLPRFMPGPVEAGETTTVTLEWVAGLPVTGTTVDPESGEPIGGVTLWMRSNRLAFPVASDADGHFELHVLPGKGYLVIDRIDAPKEYASQRDRFGAYQHLVIEEETESLDFGDVELERPRSITGRVVDEAGAPVAGAIVHGEQNRRLGQGTTVTASLSCLSGEDGSFRLGESLDEEEPVQVAAHHGRQRTREALSLSAGQAAVLVLAESDRTTLTGTVHDETGQPVSGATVSIWKSYEQSPHQAEKELLEGGDRPASDEDGRFAADVHLEPEGSYALVVTSPEIERTVTRWSSGEALVEGIDVVVPRLVARRGRLLDESGTPRTGVVLRAILPARPEIESTTDAEGRFVLPGFPPGGAFVVAMAEGLGVRGAWLEGMGSGDWTLRTDEPPLTALPRPVSRDLELELARALASAALDAARDSARTPGPLHQLQDLAAIDPGAALDALDEGLLEESWRDAVLSKVVRTLAAQDPDEALALLSTMELGLSEVLAHVDVVAELPATERARRVEQLGLALAEARRVTDPSHRLVAMARVAEGLRNEGEEEPARAVIEELRPAAAELPAADWPGFARGRYAEELAVHDLDAALALVDELADTSARARHRANIALELADLDPKSAERVCTGLPQWNRERATPAVCHQLARIDLERAKRLADGAESVAEGYGEMARALASEDPEAARSLLELAFERFESRHRRRPRAWWGVRDAIFAGSLLPVAERVAPERLRDYLGRAIALRTPRPGDVESRPGDQWPAESADGALAYFVARYDRGLARELLAPALRLLRERGDQLYRSDWKPTYAALAELDPEEAARLVDDGGLPPAARGTLARVLALEGKARERYVLDECLSIWVVGDEELL